jgi:hypothetical protein
MTIGYATAFAVSGQIRGGRKAFGSITILLLLANKFDDEHDVDACSR